MTIALLLLIAASATTLVAGWVWYPNRMAARGKQARAIALENPPTLPRVSVVLATRESDDAIERRVRNLRELDYPSDLLEVVVALDFSRADARTTITTRLGASARVVSAIARGKSAALNAGVSAAYHDLLFFVDTAQSFAPDVLLRLVSVLEDVRWGAVTATLAPTSGDALMDKYWQRELAVREGQTDRHSVICVTGCAYILRREYWRDMPESLICDDLWSTYSVVTAGGRVAIESKAAVSDPRRFTREQEYARRLRTMTGMLQFIRWYPAVLSPSRNPMFIDFLLHKLVRPATPVLLALIAISTLSLVWMWSPMFSLALLVLGLIGASLPWLFSHFGPSALQTKAQTLLFAQRLVLMPLRAIRQAVRNDWDVWKPHA